MSKDEGKVKTEKVRKEEEKVRKEEGEVKTEKVRKE